MSFDNRKGEGVPVRIKDKQFLGRETRYMVDALGIELEIITSQPHAADIDDEVFVMKREATEVNP